MIKPTQAITAVTAGMLKASMPEFGVGDTVRVSVKVVEGSRERTQVFEGVVMRSRGGSGVNSNFTVRRVASHGIGVERTFLLHSPRVEKIEVVRRGVVRRAQLYYLRGLTGKAARIKERRYRPVDKAAARAAVRAAEVEAAEMAETAIVEVATEPTTATTTENRVVLNTALEDGDVVAEDALIVGSEDAIGEAQDVATEREETTERG